MRQRLADIRPSASLQILVTTVITTLWLIGIHQAHRHLIVPQELMPKLKNIAIFGTLLIGGVSAALYAARWTFNHNLHEEIKAKIASVQHRETVAPRQAMLDEKGPRYALEIRALGVAVDNYWQDGLWNRIHRHSDATTSVIPSDLSHFPDSSQDRITYLTAASEATFEYVGKDAVSNWPVPTFAAEPAKHADVKSFSGEGISGRATEAGFAYTYFLWEDDINADDASPLIDKLFAFFDANPDVPEALIMARDADTVRRWLGPAGVRPPEGLVRPTILTSVVTLLVSRTDRVDQYIRPYARAETNVATNADQTNHDYIKQYLFYNKLEREFDALSARDGHLVLSTVRSDYWAKQLPRLLAVIDDHEDSRTQKSPYLPLRWMTWQIEAFDQAPLMGYLHRPVTIRLRDEHDKPLVGEARSATLNAGWQTALASLPEGSLPQRVFHDRTNDGGLRRELASMLKQQPQPIDLNNVDQGFDIGVRIGNTGITSPFVQIALATISSYKKGGAAATVHRRSNGDVTVTMVSPPDEESKAAWEGESKRNPFMAHVPHG